MSEEGDPVALLDELAELRRNTRADRQAYWFPLLLFGALIAGATPWYIEPAKRVPLEASGEVYTLTGWPEPRAGGYWLPALLFGAVATAAWYHWRGRRAGVEGRSAAAIGTAALAVAAFTIVSESPVGWHLWPITIGNMTPLLVIAVGLLALAALERGALLWVVAVLYAGAAGLCTTYNVENVLFDLGWDPFVAHPDQDRFTALPRLLLPALVLLVGGGVAAVRALRARRAVAA
jgi:hypothetical protein